MADLTNINASVSRTPVQGSVRTTPSQRAAYVGAGDVARRANVLNEAESPQNLASLQRLDRILSSGEPLRGDVPRGFYLDLKV